jgi:hypothetical protein
LLTYASWREEKGREGVEKGNTGGLHQVLMELLEGSWLWTDSVKVLNTEFYIILPMAAWYKR